MDRNSWSRLSTVLVAVVSFTSAVQAEDVRGLPALQCKVLNAYGFFDSYSPAPREGFTVRLEPKTLIDGPEQQTLVFRPADAPASESKAAADGTAYPYIPISRLHVLESRNDGFIDAPFKSHPEHVRLVRLEQRSDLFGTLIEWAYRDVQHSEARAVITVIGSGMTTGVVFLQCTELSAAQR